MYGNKSQMSWKPNSRTFTALAPCVNEVQHTASVFDPRLGTVAIVSGWAVLTQPLTSKICSTCAVLVPVLVLDDVLRLHDLPLRAALSLPVPADEDGRIVALRRDEDLQLDILNFPPNPSQ